MKLSPDVKVGQQILRWFTRKFEKHPHCFYCGVSLTMKRPRVGIPAPDTMITKDHVYPRSKGGKDGKVNTVRACFKCNQAKASRTLNLFRKDLTGFRDGLFWAETKFQDREGAR